MSGRPQGKNGRFRAPLKRNGFGGYLRCNDPSFIFASTYGEKVKVVRVANRCADRGRGRGEMQPAPPAERTGSPTACAGPPPPDSPRPAAVARSVPPADCSRRSRPSRCACRPWRWRCAAPPPDSAVAAVRSPASGGSGSVTSRPAAKIDAGLQRLDQILLDDDRAARRVDEHRRRLHLA